MTPHRFRALLASHGADTGRWPPAERDEGLAMMQQGQPDLIAAWEEEAALDAWLDDGTVVPPGAKLMARILASVPRRRSPTWLAALPRWLLPGAGLVGVGLAGSLAGALTVAVAMHLLAPSVDSGWIEGGSAFAEEPNAWSDE